MSQDTPPRKRWLGTGIRAALGFGLAALLLAMVLKRTGADLPQTLQSAHRGYLGCVLLLQGAVIGITVLRWYLLLRVQDIRLSLKDVARLTMIGFFFNLAIPGAVGGDLVKMAYVARQAPDKRTEAVFSIMVDRIVGILGLFIVASIMVLWSLPFLQGLGEEHRVLQMAAATVGLGSVAGVMGILVVEFHHVLLRIPGVAGLVEFGARKLPAKITETIVRVMDALDQYRRSRGTMLIALALALCVHVSISLCLYCAGQAVREPVLQLKDYLLTTQVANAIAAIPVTPAGVGARDAVGAAFFSAMGAESAKAGVIPVLLTLAILFWGMVGAVVFVLSPVARHAAAQSENSCTTQKTPENP